MTNSLIPAATLQDFANDLLLAMGSPAESAPIIAKSLVKSDCCGIYTHGIGQLPMYARMLNDGAI
ncbi:MAG: LDH2 family malate/lactate/ureidoglycolate dehydrogenase, partial [Planctomycetota bacterium]